MNASEISSNREAQLKQFESKYSELRNKYADALQHAIDVSDRPKQCMHIKQALDANKEITTLIQGFVATTETGGKVTADRLQTLRNDIEQYKIQHGEIQQGKDKLYALQRARSQLDEKVEISYGIQMIYIAIIVIGIVILLFTILGSSFRGVSNTQTIPSVVPGGFT